MRAFEHLGLPNWFGLELTTAKFLGALVLLVPNLPRLAKEFAYFGFALTTVSAEIAHRAANDPTWYTYLHIVFFSLLCVSYIYWRKVREQGRSYYSSSPRV